MSESRSRTKTLLKYVLPAILTNACIFLFTIIDGIFVGRGIGSSALGAVNIAMPFVMIATALNMLTSIGGVTVTAIRLGRHDSEGANQAFMHSLTANFLIAVVITLLGTVCVQHRCVGCLAQMRLTSLWSGSTCSSGHFLPFRPHCLSTSRASAAMTDPPCWSLLRRS